MDSKPTSLRYLAVLTLGALGVVYGDIGTSPLYALKQCFGGSHPLPPTCENVLGILSLILWSLILIVSLKYLAIILRATNRGEGGILALMALAFPKHAPGTGRRRAVLVGLGVFGAALLYGDGMITPAISVISAIEGLNVATPALERFVVPLTIVTLIGLFAAQSRGTGGSARSSGPSWWRGSAPWLCWASAASSSPPSTARPQPPPWPGIPDAHWVEWVHPAGGGVPRGYRRRGACTPTSATLGPGPFASPGSGLCFRDSFSTTWARAR